jgi:Rod binding domain-containing protein
MDIIKAASTAPLTPEQTAALKKLHEAATQLEGVFVGMLFKEMHSDKPDSDIFGKTSNAENTWNDMLDEKRADAIAKSGSFGIAKMVEQQLRESVIASATPLPGSGPVSGTATAPAASPAVPPTPPKVNLPPAYSTEIDP